MRKPKAEVSESWAGEEDSSQSDSSAAHSILEISGPTIPSPGPSGVCHMNRLLSSMCSLLYKAQNLFRNRCVCFIGRWKDYSSLGWPGPEECQRTRRVDLTTVASTWLAVSAKNIEYAHLLKLMYTFTSFRMFPHGHFGISQTHLLLFFFFSEMNVLWHSRPQCMANVVCS